MPTPAIVELKLTETGMSLFAEQAKGLNGIQEASRIRELLAAIAVQIVFNGGEMQLRDQDGKPLLKLSVSLLPETTQ